MIHLQRLEGFYWVAKAEGYARAARAFPYPISQPGVHQQVRRLEEDLGNELFDRVGRDRVVLTPAGKQLFAAVAPFLDRLPAVEQSIRIGVPGGLVRVQSSPHLLRHLLPAWRRRVQREHPEIELELSEASTPHLRFLQAAEVDLVVDHVPEPPAGLRAKRIALARAFLIVARHYRGLGRRGSELRLEDLKAETFIAYGADRRSRELQLGALELHGMRPSRILAADSSETILGLVAAGLGYSIVPSVLAGGPREPGVHTRRLVHPVAEFPIHAVWRDAASPNPLVATVLGLAPSGAK